MSEAVPLSIRPLVERTIQRLTLWVVFGGLGACGTENTNKTSDGSVSQASTESDQTQPDDPASTESDETQLNGQSGSEYDQSGGNGADRPACPCGLLKNPLRATVLEVIGHIEGADHRPVRLGNVRLRVEELLGNTTGLEIGSELSGPWFGALPCYYGCAAIAPGDEVLVFYRFPQPCINTSGDDCPLGDTIPGHIELTPWGDTAVLAQLSNGNLELPVQNLSVLDSPECDTELGNVGNRLGPNDAEAACYETAPPP